MLRKIAASIAAVALVVVVVSFAHSEDKEMAGAAAKPDQAAMMEQMMKLAQPGAEHKRLAEMAGTWTAETKGFQPDGTDCGGGKGTMTITPILGGRYIQMNLTAEMTGPMGKMPYNGMGLVGYDNMKKKYVEMWADDMSTGWMSTEGTMEGNVVTSEGECTDPMTGKPAKVKDIATFIDATHHKYELFMTGPDGKLFKCMEANYTKK